MQKVLLLAAAVRATFAFSPPTPRHLCYVEGKTFWLDYPQRPITATHALSSVHESHITSSSLPTHRRSSSDDSIAPATRATTPKQRQRRQASRTCLTVLSVLIATAALTSGGSAWAAAAARKAEQAAATSETTEACLHLGQRLANTIRRRTGWPDRVILLVISALPVVELRGGLPVGLWMGLPPAQTFALACIGNLIPVPFILLALYNIPWLMDKVTPMLQRKLKDVTGKQMNWQALAVFVGIPLPGTGAWTGAAIGALFKLSWLESLIGCVVGIISAAAIMTAVVLSGIWGGVAVAVALSASLFFQVLEKRKSPEAGKEPPSNRRTD